MEGSFTDQQVHAWLDDIGTNAWVSLHYDSPALHGIGAAELSGGGYVRVKVPFSRATGRTIWSLDDVKFTGLSQNQLTHFGIWDAQTNGILRAFGRLPEPQLVVQGWGFILYTGELALSVA
jgi:hypothetical protein